jgi:hypothetical protein
MYIDVDFSRWANASGSPIYPKVRSAFGSNLFKLLLLDCNLLPQAPQEYSTWH